MPAFKLEQFGGMLPAWSDRLLPAGQSALSVNSYLFGGELTGWREPKHLRDLSNGSAKAVYRIPTTIKGTATATVTFAANPAGGATLTIGELTYTFVTGSVTKAFDVLIETAEADTAQNLLMALVKGEGADTKYGTECDDGDECGANPSLDLTAGAMYVDNYGADPFVVLKAVEAGAAYNETKTDSSDSGVTITPFTGGINPYFDASITGASAWLEFVDEDTDVLRSPVVDDKFNRYYFASPSEPPQYNTYDRIQNGDPAFLLGVPPPCCAPGVTVSGGGSLSTAGADTAFSPAANEYIVANTTYVFPYIPDGSVELDAVNFMPVTTSTTAEYAAVLYDDDGSGAPGQLLNQGTINRGTTADTEASSAFNTPTSLLRGITYWIGIIASEQITIYKGAIPVGTSTYNGAAFASTFTNGPPLQAPSATGQDAFQVWADVSTSSIIAARAYVYTWVTEYGEESPPSTPTLVNGWSNGTWTISLFQPPPEDMGISRNIKTVRIYRTVPAQGGQTDYFWVADVDAGTVSYDDTFADSVVALNVIMPSTTWFPPPATLVGIAAMPNGIMVGFKDNELWFSEPYRPHAWPPGYVITTEFPIVGIGVTGQAVVAATGSVPYIAQGVNPATIALTKLQSVEPCTSKGSIISNEAGVYYTSPNGLIKVTQSAQCENTTESWVTRERWRKLTPQTGQHAIPLHGTYFCYSVTEQSGFYIDLQATDATSFTIWPQPGGHRIGFSQLTVPNGYDIAHIDTDPWSGVGLTVQNGAVYYYDFSDLEPTIMPYKWKSKKYQQTTRKNFEAMKIFFDVPAGTATQGTRVTTAEQPTLASDQYGIVRVYADDVLVTTREIRTSGELLRILSGFKADTWQWEFEGRVTITNMQAATSVKELASV